MLQSVRPLCSVLAPRAHFACSSAALLRRGPARSVCCGGCTTRHIHLGFVSSFVFVLGRARERPGRVNRADHQWIMPGLIPPQSGLVRMRRRRDTARAVAAVASPSHGQPPTRADRVHASSSPPRSQEQGRPSMCGINGGGSRRVCHKNGVKAGRAAERALDVVVVSSASTVVRLHSARPLCEPHASPTRPADAMPV